MKAEISRSSVFWHFKSKDGLLQAVVEDFSRWLANDLLEAGNAQRGLAAVEVFLARRQETYRQQPRALRLASVLYSEAVAGETVGHVLGPLFAELSRTLRKEIARWISEAIEDGELSAEVDPEALALVIVAAFQGVVSDWNLDPEGYSLESGDDAIRQLLTYLRLPAGAGRRVARASAAS